MYGKERVGESQSTPLLISFALPEFGKGRYTTGEEWRVAVSSLIAEGEQIGRHLQTIAQQFESVDESF